MLQQFLSGSYESAYSKPELQWRQAPPCSSWDTGRVASLLFSPGGICLNLDLGNRDTKVGD